MRKYNFTKEELEEKYLELKTVTRVAEHFAIPLTSMCLQFKKLNVIHSRFPAKSAFNEDFFEINSPESFYLAGFIAADGNVDKNLSRITIALAEKDINFLEDIKKLICCNAKLSKHIDYGSKRNPLYKDTVNYFLRFSSKKMVEDLQKWNIIPNKTKTYDFPECAMTNDLVSHYMRGYFDGDGCLGYSENQLFFTVVGNLSFLEKYQSILEKQCGVKHNSIHKDRNIYVLKYCGNNVVPKICELLYNNSTFHLDRKYNIYKSLIK